MMPVIMEMFNSNLHKYGYDAKINIYPFDLHESENIDLRLILKLNKINLENFDKKIFDYIFNDYAFNNDINDLKKVLNNLIKHFEKNLYENLDTILNRRLCSYMSTRGYIDDLLNGICMYHNMIKLRSELVDNLDNFKNNIFNICNKIFRLNNLIVSYYSNKDINYKIFDYLKMLLKKDRYKEKYVSNFDDLIKSKNEGILLDIPQIFFAKGFKFKTDFEYIERICLLVQLLNRNYLFYEIREKIGAYSSVANNYADGRIVFNISKSPNLSKTYNSIRNTKFFLENFKISHNEFEILKNMHLKKLYTIIKK
jgi:Zn-dependent M16 (insulinase) family peptidase